MTKFRTLQVTDIRKEAVDAVSIAFDINGLEDEFKFIPGQSITLNETINGEEVHRSYSLCSSPFENEMRVAVKKVENGKMSTFLNETLKVGDSIHVMHPMGSFVAEPNPSNAKHYVHFAAGSGVTPIISMIKSVLKKEPNSKVTLFYGNKDEAHTIFHNELTALNEANSNFEYVNIWSKKDAPAQLSGRIDFSKTLELMNTYAQSDLTKVFYTCGPNEMMAAIKNALIDLDYNSADIHIEYFAAPVEEENTTTPVAAASDFEGEADVTVIIDMEEINFKLNTNGESILDAADEEGADAPFSCKGGVCCTCKAQVIEGSARMTKNYALTDEEVADGFILTCQSHPTSAKVVLDFDV